MKKEENRRYSDVTKKDENRRHSDVIKDENRRHSDVMKDENRRHSDVMKTDEIRRYSDIMKTDGNRRHFDVSNAPPVTKSMRELKPLNVNNASSRHSLRTDKNTSETDNNCEKADLLSLASSSWSSVTRSGSINTVVSVDVAQRTSDSVLPAKDRNRKQVVGIGHPSVVGSMSRVDAGFSRDRDDVSYFSSVSSSSSSSSSTGSGNSSSVSSYDDLSDNDRTMTVTVDACVGTDELLVDTGGGGDDGGDGNGDYDGGDDYWGGDDGGGDGGGDEGDGDDGDRKYSYCSWEPQRLDRASGGRQSNSYKATKIQKR